MSPIRGLTVGELFQGFPSEVVQQLNEEDLKLHVQALCSDSREVRTGSVFVAIRGGSADGHHFLEDVKKKGAAMVVAEEVPEGGAPQLPFVKVRDSRKALALLAANFYGNPSRRMKVIGVTGTSGKTTTTYLIESILQAAGYEVGVIGTVNFRHGGKILPSTHTTPGAVELQRLLARMRDEGCNAVVMEVSSHALKQHRTAQIAFDAAVFTNLSPEHLDFHPDMEDYFQSKSLLFTDSAVESSRAGKKPFAVVNGDDPYGRRLAVSLAAPDQGSSRCFSFALSDEFPPDHATLCGSGLRYGLSGIQGEVNGIRVESPLIGAFNASNVLAALSVGVGMGLSPEAISKGISGLKSVPGRLERVPGSKGIHVFVDYAHKPDALDKVLQTLQEVRGDHKMITVFGCGGDRDRKKRPLMGKIAVTRSDHVWITSDNPRTEDPNAIISEILAGTTGFRNFKVEPDRRKAIHAAIRMAASGDLVLIAGKGHEDYQIIADPSAGGTRKIHFDDREVAKEAVAGTSDLNGSSS